MQTENNNMVEVFQLKEAISEANRRIGKIEALLDSLASEYLDWPGTFDAKTLVDFIKNGMPTENTEAEQRAYDWANGFEHIQTMVDIIDDYLGETKNILRAANDRYTPGA